MAGRVAWIAALTIVCSAFWLASCAAGDDGDDQSATQAATQAATQTAGAEPAEQPEPGARVQVIRNRASLGSPDAPVVIQEHSDFL